MSRSVPFGRKVVVYGPSGAGKSTVSESLADTLGLPWIELDSIFHARPGWDDLSVEEFRARVSDLLGAHGSGWIMDGNYGMVRDLILPHADTVVWLDLPFRTVYRWLAGRTLARSFKGTELWNGNRETLRQTFTSRDSMLVWGLRDRQDARRVISGAVSGLRHARVYRLRNTGQVRYMLKHATPASVGLPSLSNEQEDADANVPGR